MKSLKILLFLLPIISFSQVGIGTTNPQGVLDINSNNGGLVIPRVTNITSVTQTVANPIKKGTMVYNNELNRFCFFIDDDWFCPVLKNDCNSAIPTPKFSDACPDYTYIKPINHRRYLNGQGYGTVLDLSDDGNVLVIGNLFDNGIGTGVNGSSNPGDNSRQNSGVVYVFRKTNGIWNLDAYIKYSNSDAGTLLGHNVSISGDGNTIVSNVVTEQTTTVNGNTSVRRDYSPIVFSHDGSNWQEDGVLPMQYSHTSTTYSGLSGLDLNYDGTVLAVGRRFSNENAVGINGPVSNYNLSFSGSVYVYRKQSNNSWLQEAFIKHDVREIAQSFGSGVALNRIGNKLAIGIASNNNKGSGINPPNAGEDHGRSGAVSIYDYNGTNWQKTAFLKAQNPDNGDNFGVQVEFDDAGTTLAVSAPNEESVYNCIDGDQDDNRAQNAGAVYIFSFENNSWSQQAYLKPTNTRANFTFGIRIGLSDDGDRIIVGALDDASDPLFNGDIMDRTKPNSGAVYLFSRCEGNWNPETFLKAPVPETNNLLEYNGFTYNDQQPDSFAFVTMSKNGNTIAIGAPGEDGDGMLTGGNVNTNDYLSRDSGAVFVFESCN